MVAPQENTWEFCSRDYAQVGSVAIATDTPAYPLRNIIDGDRLTFFKASIALPLTITLDLGASVTFDRIFLRSPKFYGVKTAGVDISGDGVTYEALPIVPYGTMQASVLKSVRVSARYLQLDISALPDGVSELRIAELSVCRKHFICDGYRDSLQKAMPANPSARSMEWAGRVMVPLMHGNNVRVQKWGGERRHMTISFPLVKREFVELLEWYKDRSVPFGIIDHEFQFLNLIIVPGGLRVNEAGSDGPGHADGVPDPERVYPSKTWYSVEMEVQECVSTDPVTEEEPPGPAQEGEIIMTETEGV